MKTVILEITWLRGCVTGWGNGYVLIPKGHKLHGKHYDDINVNIHGGLTFSDEVDENFAEKLGLNVSDVGSWAVGFDTAHYGDTPDTCPKSFVQAEVNRLLEQLKAI